MAGHLQPIFVCIGTIGAIPDRSSVNQDQEAAVRAATDHVGAHGASIISEFMDLVALPNVSSDLPGVRAVADEIVAMLIKRGLTPRLIETEGVAPIVTARIDVAADAPTVGIYAHYDGQPVDPHQWATPPFTPTIVSNDGEVALPRDGRIDPEWRIYGRSTSDDKAPVQALVSAIDALTGVGIEPTVNVVLLFEGEEEAGSPHLADYLKAHASTFAADVWLICDGPVHQSRLPQVIFGVRGIAQMDITVFGPMRGLHSGHYGNWVPNPSWELVQLLATMRDSDGNVTIEGFYDDVVPPSPSELNAIAAIPSYERGLLDEVGVQQAEGGGETLVERMYRPSLNLRGFAAGPVGDEAANVLPDSATVSIDVRLPPDHDPDAMLDRVQQHVEAQGFSIVDGVPTRSERLALGKTARVTRDPHYTGMRVPLDTAEATAVLASAEAASQTGEVVAMPTLGGSVPIVHFNRILGTPTIILPMANHDNNQHDANENIRIANLWYGVRLMAAVLTMDLAGAESD